MRFFFPLRFVSGFSFSANRRRFTPGKPRSRPCASRNESTSLREVRSKIRFSAGTVRIIYCSPAKIRSQKSQVPPNSRYRPISERGTASDYISSDCAPWSKTRSTPLEKHVFELGTPRRDTGLIPRIVCLIPSGYRPVKNVNMLKKKAKNE